MKNFIILLAIMSFFIFPPIGIIIVTAIIVKSFLGHKSKSDYALSALTVKYIYDNMSEKEKAKIDYEVNHIAYEQYIKGTSLEVGMNYDEAIKLSEKTLMTKKRTSPWGYWLFLANVFAECQVPNPFGNKWYTARFPFKELAGEEKYAIKGMQDFLRDKYQIEVDISEINNTDPVFPSSPMPNIDSHSTFEKQSSKSNEIEKYVPKDQYQALEKKLGEQDQEIGELRDFFKDITPLLEKLEEKPEITDAILSGKLDADLARAVLEGKVRIENKTTVAKANKKVKKSRILPKEEFNAFKNQYKKEHGIDITDEQALAICLHENAILNTQKFISAIEADIGEIDSEKKWKLSEDIKSYSLSLIFVYLGSGNKLNDVGALVLDEERKFIKTISGATNESQEKAITEFLLEKLNQNVEMWLAAPFEKDIIIDKINSGISYVIPPTYNCRPNIEKLICNIEFSMKHFGIIF